MGATRCFNIHGDLAILRLPADYPTERVTSKVKSAVVLARDLQITKLLVIAPSLTAALSAAEQGWSNKDWISAAADDLRIVLVGRRELIGPSMRGVHCFPSEE